MFIKKMIITFSIIAFIGTSLSDISNSRKRMLAKICGTSGNGKEFEEELLWYSLQPE